jgi:hypothetical protein
MLKPLKGKLMARITYRRIPTTQGIFYGHILGQKHWDCLEDGGD